VGKEEELRAQAEVESEVRMAEILGRPTTPEQPVTEPEVEAPEAVFEEPEVKLYEEPVVEAAEPEPVAEAAEDVLSGDDALAWLESLTVGKEEELRAQAEVESETRMAEILGRPTTPEQPVPEPEVEAPEAVFEELEPELEDTLYEEPVAEAVEPELEAEAPVVEEPEPEPIIQMVEEPVAEAAEPELEAEALPVEEPEPEPVTQMLEEPVVEAAELELEAETPAVEEPEPEPVTQLLEEPVSEAVERELAVETPAVEEPELEVVTPPVEEPEPEPVMQVAEEPEPVTLMVEEPVAEAAGPTQDELDEMRNHLKRKRSDHETRLKLSRALWNIGEIKEAMKNYGTLIKSGAKMGEIYEDLQQYLTTHPKDSDVLRTLGDAYMKDGDLDRALEIYNEAMNTL
jgi:hypothetical protein